VKEYAEIKRKHRSNEQQETKRKAATISRVLTQSFSHRAPEVPEEKRDFLESSDANRPYEAIAVKVEFGDSAGRLRGFLNTGLLFSWHSRREANRRAMACRNFAAPSPQPLRKTASIPAAITRTLRRKIVLLYFWWKERSSLFWMLVVVFLSHPWTLAPPA